jgi:PAS domain S-box-containing protein
MQPAQGIELTRQDQEPGVSISGPPPAGNLCALRRSALSLRSRLLLLVVASILPLIGLGMVREYWNYLAQRQQASEGLQTTARGLAVAVERDIQSRIAALEALATSPALLPDSLARFDAQVKAFLASQPPGTLLGLSGPDAGLVRLYGSSAAAARPADIARVFASGRPLVTDLHGGDEPGQAGFGVDVPVFHDARVAYDLFMRLPPAVLATLIEREHLPSHIIAKVIDASGVVVARVPDPDGRFIGSRVVPGLWAVMQASPEGLSAARMLDGTPALVAFTRIAPFGWSVAAGAPEDVLFAPMRAAMIHIGLAGVAVLSAALLLARLAARHITRPIERLRHLAAHGDAADGLLPPSTGLPETDTVARVLLAAAAERRESARALAESEQRFRALFERSSSGTILLDPDTTGIIDANEAAAAIVGYTVEAFRHCRITEFRLGRTVEEIQQTCRAVAAGQTLRYETQLTGRKGPRDLLVAAVPLVVSGRTLVLLNLMDVTDLRRAEAELRINEERLELARQGANLGIWDWDIVSGTLTWSDHNWYLHGLEPRAGGLTPEDWQRAVHPADLPRALAELRTAIVTPGYPYAVEYSVVLPDGSLRRLLSRGQVVRGPDGRAIRMVGINMDVTARYEAEMARDRLIVMLETERSRLADIIEALPIGVGIVDRSGCLMLSNPIMQSLVGPTVPSLDPGKAERWIGHRPDGSRVAPADYPIQRALRGETVLPGVDFLYRSEDGKETWISVGALPLRWENGQVQEALAILQDIDAEKRLIDLQQQANARLEQRVQAEIAARQDAQQRAAHAERMQALGQIAGGIAHDFNNVLQAVSGGAALVERRPNDPERVVRHARMILDAARRGAAITSRLLAFSRRGDLRAESLDAGALLHDMAEVLTHTLGGSVICAVDVPPGLPPLLADRGQLETVLVNLATNARDAMPSGGTLTMSAAAEIIGDVPPHAVSLRPGRYIRITVADTGSGMNEAVLARVTEPFFTTKSTGQGTGLGLAMAKGFAEQSGGGLFIDSVVGQGTRVMLWLPQAVAESAAAPALAPEVAAGPQRPCVLLVDDDPIVREVLAASLDDAGYSVTQAASGTEALATLAAAERMDVMVSDLTMPGMDGVTLIRKAQEQRPGLPAVLLTGYAGSGAALAVGGAVTGAFSLLRKPVAGPQLVDRINALLASAHAVAGA